MEEYGTLHAEPIKVGKYKGHKYFVNMNQFLCLNGYAEIPEKWKDGDEDELTVHGGITFKGYVRDGASKVKVIGFDTLHAFDDQKTRDLKNVERECKYMIDEMIEKTSTNLTLQISDELTKLLKKQGITLEEYARSRKKVYKEVENNESN